MSNSTIFFHHFNKFHISSNTIIFKKNTNFFGQIWVQFFSLFPASHGIKTRVSSVREIRFFLVGCGNLFLQNKSHANWLAESNKSVKKIIWDGISNVQIKRATTSIFHETNFTKIFVKMSSRKEYSVMDLDICPSFTSFMVPYSKWVCPGPGTITRNYLPINFKELNCISKFFYNSSLIRQKYYYITMLFQFGSKK